MNEVLSASNLDPTALTVVTRKLEVRSVTEMNNIYKSLYFNRILDTEIGKQNYKFNRNLLKIPAGGRLTSWLFAKRRGSELNLGSPTEIHLLAGRRI